MESVAKPISLDPVANRDSASAEFVEDIGEQENYAESCQHDSEYNTASDSTTSETGNEKVNQKLEVIEISDDELNDDDAPDDEEDEGSSIESGGEEDDENAELTQSQIQESKRQVDDDEDRSNPQYIPKRGTFYEHDDRTAENADAEAEVEEEGEVSEKKVSFSSPAPNAVKLTKKWQSSSDRWSHDRYDESEQAPKSKAELVSAYGYDIRNEESPPRARRRRRYGRGPSKYTRKWEDENAYTKAPTRRIALNSKDEFPEIDENAQTRNNRRRGERKIISDDHEYYSNRSQSNHGDGGSEGSYGRPSHENNQLKPKNQSTGYRVKSSMEFKNQNRLRQNVNVGAGVEHNRADSFIITRNNNLTGGGHVENSHETMDHMDHIVEEKQTQSGDYKARPQHHQHHHQSQSVHNINGNEFTEFMPNYLHNQMNTEQHQHAIHNTQINQPNMLLSRDGSLNYTGDSLKIMQQQQGVRNHNTTASSTNIIPMGNNSDNMRQTPKRYSSLRQRTVMPTNSQATGQMMSSSETDMQQPVVGNQDRLKISSTMQKQPQVAKYETMPGQQAVLGQDHLELVGVESPKLKMRQAKSHHSQPAPPQTLQVTQQTAILPQSAPQSTNYYAPEYIRQPSLPAHRSASQATAKNHAALPNQAAYQQQFASNNTASAFVPPTAQTTPAFIAPPPPQSTNPQQIINYITPPAMGPTQAQYPAFPNYQNYNSMTTPSIPPHQSQGGITYYAPHTQQQPRAVVSQRRPTNAIPILAPPERSGNGKGRGRLPTSTGNQPVDDSECSSNSEVKSNVENIDHILDNMFVRRTPYEQPSLKPLSSSPPVSPVASKNDTIGPGVEQTEEAFKNLSVSSEQQQSIMEVSAKSLRSESPSNTETTHEEK